MSLEKMNVELTILSLLTLAKFCEDINDVS